MTKAEINRGVREAVVRALELPIAPEDLPESEPLFGADGEVDSILSIKLVVELEETFGIEVDDDDLTEELFGTVAALAAYVETKLSGRGVSRRG